MSFASFTILPPMAFCSCIISFHLNFILNFIPTSLFSFPYHLQHPR
eukprot:UN04836